MRKDMAAQIVEKERIGSGNGEYTSRQERRQARRRLRMGDEDFETGRGIKAHVKHPKCNRKELNERLNPLVGFLRKNIGRPWDKVFSEICENINLNSAVQYHIRQHVTDFVELNVRMIDGKPHTWVGGRYVYDKKNSPDWLPLTRSGGSDWRSMYVNPSTGLLCIAPIQRYSWETSRDDAKAKFARECFISKRDPLTAYAVINELWYAIDLRSPTMAENKKKQFCDRKLRWAKHLGTFSDVGMGILEQLPEPPQFYAGYYTPLEDKLWARCKAQFGRPLWPVGKRQLNSKEIVRLEAEMRENIRNAA